ncbi:Type I transmembrane sorting receptor, partial [Podila verticillata]
MDMAFQGKSVDNDVFSISFKSENAHLILGGIDTEYTEILTYAPLLSGPGYWEVSIDGVVVGNTVVLPELKAVVDSGASLIYVTPSRAKMFYDSIKDSKLFDGNNGYYSVPCNNIPSISLKIQDKDFHISKEDMNLGSTEAGSTDCVM